MFLVKSVLKGVGETLFLRYNLLGDAQEAYRKLKCHQTWNTGETDTTEEFTDDYGLSVLVPAYSVILAQMINLDRFFEGDAKANVKSQLAMQREVAKVQQAGPIITPAPGNGVYSRQ